MEQTDTSRLVLPTAMGTRIRNALGRKNLRRLAEKRSLFEKFRRWSNYFAIRQPFFVRVNAIIFLVIACRFHNVHAHSSRHLPTKADICPITIATWRRILAVFTIKELVTVSVRVRPGNSILPLVILFDHRERKLIAFNSGSLEGSEQQCCYDKNNYLMLSYDQMWGSKPRRSHNLGYLPWNEANKVRVYRSKFRLQFREK